ncbi:hypothetical protein [Salinibius halmophilus]|uniref:hypothetical protein n=1 Tax=Salinibius halmophilus TaxID=1853216 RepID=UPI000E66C979|nr:hypothetical protein [Salinibius halmophilus]
MKGIVAATLILACSASSEVLFSDNFDNTPDWTSGMRDGDDVAIPRGWNDAYDGASMYPASEGGRDSLEILAEHSDKARGNTGKSLVAYRESYTPPSGWAQFNSDGILAKHIEGKPTQLYVEFWLRFGDTFTMPGGGYSKLFRIKHSSDPANPWQNFLQGGNGPSLIWMYSNGEEYGQRNMIALRGDPVQDDEGKSYYYLNSSDIPDAHRRSHRGDFSFNFANNLKGEGVNNQDPLLVDQLNGGLILDDPDEIVTHEQVFGKRGTWNKIAFFVKMNSAPGATDGVLMQWLNDTLILNMQTIPWHRFNDEIEGMPYWNKVLFGGNDYYQTYPNEQRFEDWYAFDDVVIRSSIPTQPLAPTNFQVEALQ